MTTIAVEPKVSRTPVPEVVRRRLTTLDGRLDPYSWLVTILIVTIAGILRLNGVGRPQKLIFDEVYYPTDAWDMIKHGVEWNEENGGPGYVVHPPLGKWLIALGELVFGNNTLGWRVPTAIAGTLMVLVLIRVAYRLFHSTVLAGTAGLLLTLDGFQLVLSRTSLLDIFLGLFVLMAFACLVLDRDHYRRRLLRALEQGRDPARTRVVPWWLFAAGVCLGLASGVKLSAPFFLPAFAALTITWRVQARRSAGVRHPFSTGILGDLGWGLLSFLLTGVVYLTTWTGWLVTDAGFFRHWRADNGLSEPPVLGALLNLWHYHQSLYSFHTGLAQTHRYQSWPWQWLLLGRPVAFDWSTPAGCGAPSCAGEILLLGTPVLWWSFLPALAALAWMGVARRDWRAWAILLPVAAGLLPWFYYAVRDGRTMFSFYALPAVPFLILAVVYVLGAIMSPRRGPQTLGIVVAGLYVTAVALCFAYFFPIFVGQMLPYQDWYDRMWLGNRWI
ncbi:phospholipid carrier-dependent glycosyltransferase [Paractinoplanes ferrugineus]|uniref:Polyprenol-phosphate-mannose--protein mannosyltransferase n=1 Tax=Paractinoplanes ferrugineus TaxID=113564 RepID=A0A919IWS3_9ACTN|nr:phospholipid carrier-dependent glycosyltransferase [Actinoplanes ferrugineus]GIE10496.1 phospholipid carrier-dependent glycosyltransferase [Actinoplanes ferrugineus]